MDILQVLINGATLVYIILKLHRIDKKVDVMDARLEFIENNWTGEQKIQKKKK